MSRAGAAESFGTTVSRSNSECAWAFPSSLSCLNDSAAPARDINAYGIAFDGSPVATGQEIQAVPGVKLIRRC